MIDQNARPDVYQQITDRMIAALEAGTVPWHKPWSGGGKNMPRNAMTGRLYRGGNIFWLGFMGQLLGYTDNRWLTFKQAMAAGGKFKGEKGDSCRRGTIAMLWKPIIKNVTDAQGNLIFVEGRPKTRTFLFLKSYTVFNVEQFTDLKLPKPREKDGIIEQNTDAREVWDNYISTRGPKVDYGFDHACYYPGTDRIELPEFQQFDGEGEAWSTMFHEATHSTLHKTRLNREGTDDAGTHPFGAKQYSQEELVAEMGAAFLCALTGIEATLDNSAAYLANWLQVLKDDNKAVLYAAGRAQKAVDYILGIKEEKEISDENVDSK